MAQNKKRRGGQRHRKNVPALWQNVGLALLALLVVGSAGYALSRKASATPGTTLTTPSVATGAPAPVVGRIAMLGDSYTGGSAEGGGDDQGWPAIVANRLGAPHAAFAEGGTGYVAGESKHLDFGSRVDAVIAYKPSVVVIFGSRNDSYFTRSQTEAAVTSVLQRLKAGLPRAKVIVVGPLWWAASPPPGSGPTAVEATRAATERAGLTFTDPVALGWLPANHPEWVGTDRVHPNNRGHLHLADLIQALLHRNGVG